MLITAILIVVFILTLLVCALIPDASEDVYYDSDMETFIIPEWDYSPSKMEYEASKEVDESEGKQ